MKKPVLAVHGGAWNIPDELWTDHREGCEAAWQAGMTVLCQGGSALAGIAAAIAMMEDNPVFDAGFGSHLNEQGQVELDAGLMTGDTLANGAVLAVSRVRHPIDLALHVLLHSPHSLFTAAGAHALAEEAGFPMVEPASLIHPREQALHDRIRAGDKDQLDIAWRAQPGDTVGAVALDSHGTLAAGNSTGGTMNKPCGRIGDAPLVGVGFYADNHRGAVVCTGWGEAIMSSAMAMTGLFALDRMGPQAAAQAAVTRLSGRVGGYGGILVLAPDGRFGVAYNTQRMAYRALTS